jgi:hypothetical protein
MREKANRRKFFHRLPDRLDKASQVYFGSIGISSDIISICYNDIVNISSTVLERRGQGDLEFSHEERLRMISCCWNIVDHVNNIRIAVKAAKIDAMMDKDFRNIANLCEFLRNKMDHLSQNVPNRPKLKRGNPPIFGGVTFTVIYQRIFILRKALDYIYRIIDA